MSDRMGQLLDFHFTLVDLWDSMLSLSHMAHFQETGIPYMNIMWSFPHPKIGRTFCWAISLWLKKKSMSFSRLAVFFLEFAIPNVTGQMEALRKSHRSTLSGVQNIFLDFLLSTAAGVRSGKRLVIFQSNLDNRQSIRCILSKHMQLIFW